MGKYEVIHATGVHEAMGRTYAGGPIYSHAFSVDLKACSRLVFVSGQVPLDVDGNLVSADDFEVQFNQVFANLKASTESAGATMNDIVSLRTLLTRETDLDQFHKLRQEWYPQYFGDKPFPPNTLIVVKRLVWEDIRLEVEAVLAY